MAKRAGKPLPTWVNTVIDEKNLPTFLTYKELAEISGVKTNTITAFLTKNKVQGELGRSETNRLQLRFRTSTLKKQFKQMVS